MNKLENRSIINNRLCKNALCTAVLLCLSISAANASSDFSIFEITDQKPLQLARSIHLDTSKTEPIDFVNTSGSRKDVQEESSDFNTFSEIPNISPSEYNQQKTANEKEAVDTPPKLKELSIDTDENSNLTTPPNRVEDLPQLRNAEQSNYNSPFAPVIIDSTPVKSNLNLFRGKQDVSSNEEAEQNSSENLYPLNAQTDVNYNDPQNYNDEKSEYENLTISEIEFRGLNSVHREDIENLIQTKVNSKVQEHILQEDLQNIFATGNFTENISVEPEVLQDGTVKIVFTLPENKPINKIIINGASVVKESEILNIVGYLKNTPQNIRSINEAISKIDDYYYSKGYMLAKVSSIDDDADGNLIFTIQEGIIDEITIEGNTKTKDYVINRNIITKAGDVYNEECLKQDLQRVFATSIFEEVNKDIKETEEGSGKYRVAIVVKESGNTNNISIGGGIDSALGIFGQLGLTENNFQGKGQRVSLNGLIGSGILVNDNTIKNRMNYQVELNFFEPYFLNADNSLASKLYIRELGSYQIPLAIERRIGFNAQLQHKFNNNEKLRGTFDAGVEHINLKEGDLGQISNLFANKGIDISRRAKQLQGGFFVNLAPGLVYNDTDTNINPRNGILAELKVNEAIGISNIKHTNTRVGAAITRFLPIASKSSLSLTAKGGAKLIGNEMPEIMAYRLGGPNTIRGFKYSGVGSGNAYLMGSAELATPVFGLDRLKYEFLKNMRLTFFVDAGQVFDKTLTSVVYDRPLGAISIGVGLKVYIPGCGPISIDYGLPITNVGKYNSQNGYFSFGSDYFSGYNW